MSIEKSELEIEEEENKANLNREDAGSTYPKTVTDTVSPKNTILDSLDTAYADDLTLATASNEPKKAEDLLEEKLLIFKRFIETRGMEAAAHKPKVINLNRHGIKYKPKVRYNNKEITVVEKQKMLGVIYNEDMTFNDHLKDVISNIHNRVRVMMTLNTANWGPTQETATVLHKCYIESIVRFIILAWYPYLTL